MPLNLFKIKDLRVIQKGGGVLGLGLFICCANLGQFWGDFKR